MLDKMEAEIRARVGDIIYGVDTDTIEQVVVDILRDRRLTLSLIETNTGGIFASRFTEVPGGFQVLQWAQTLSNHRAREILSENTKETPPLATSADLSEHLAAFVRNTAKTDIGMAIVGDDDPNVGPFKKFTGDTYIGLSSENPLASKHLQLGGITNDARVRITSFAFEVLRKYVRTHL
jgi:nicotinamide-nucleotide amidase